MMASTIAQALAEVQGPKFDLAVGYTVPCYEHKPAEVEVAIAFVGFSDQVLTQMAGQLAASLRADPYDAEDAVQDALLDLMERRPELFRQDPTQWMGLLHDKAKYRLLDIVSSKKPVESIDDLIGRAGDAPFEDARPCVAVTHDEDPMAKRLLRSQAGNAWTGEEITGAIVRFRNYYGRPPGSKDFRSFNGLPALTTLYRHFPSVAEAVLAAGMTPVGPVGRRKPYTATRAAKECHAFRLKEGRWPDRTDTKRQRDRVPPASALVRFFGGTRACDVQRGVEKILDREAAR